MLSLVLAAALALAPAGDHWLTCGAEGREASYKRPTHCIVPYASQSYGMNVNLKRLRWRGWGESVATARGTEGGRPVRVRAWRPRRWCESGATAYTRIRITSSRGTVLAPVPACPGKWQPLPGELDPPPDKP